MNILVACEYSGIVSAAFRAKGHQVMSLDILPTEQPGYHLQGKLEHALSINWDMIIAFPPCTHLCIASTWRWKNDKENMSRAFALIKLIWESPGKMICIENPVGWLNNNWRAPDQILSPHLFGSRFQKRTCFWLKNLPPLILGCTVLNPRPLINQFGSGHNKPKLRSKFQPELANAMSEQWG